jgi:hypothetical protein
MTDEIVKVCVRIPQGRTDELLQIAKGWREANQRTEARTPGWDSKAIHRVAADKFGGLLQMFEHHGWPERGSDMMRQVQKRVRETYGNVEAFVAKHS